MKIYFECWRKIFLCAWLVFCFLLFSQFAFEIVNPQPWLIYIEQAKNNALTLALFITGVGVFSLVGLILWKVYLLLRGQ